MSYKIDEVTQMLDRLKFPSATAGGPRDCFTLVRYTAVWPNDYKLKHLTYHVRGGEVEGATSILSCRYRGPAYRCNISSSRLAARLQLEVESNS
jgi:hypothetical protein